MEINISDCELSQSLYTLINCCSPTGNATISLYEKESNWINANGAVPFLYQKGTMQWRVPLEKGDSVMGTGTGSDIRKCSKEFCSKYGCIAVHGVSCHMD